ncbi:DUF6286 domain-containing protein [Streptomyces sp. NPDC057638]|uniref:DUF6286 domain-containing protein n=1 Tax=Streptomyces sp. NPDC057638 TaxID=3346190 RepID=UPI00369BC1D9
MRRRTPSCRRAGREPRGHDGPGSLRTRRGPALGAGTRRRPGAAPMTRAGSARRFWSARRVPATLVALVVLGGAGILLYDIAAVRAGQPAMRWRRELADRLATWRLDDPWVLAGTAVLALLGLWLLLLALTPGLRRLLPMRPGDDGSVRAGLDRHAAELVLRDRALEVPGVRTAKVRVRRRAATVRARAHFRDLDDVRTDLDSALETAVGELGLARPPALRVRVARLPVKRK